MATAKGPITLPTLQRRKFVAYLWGESPLIVHAWSKKAITEMLAKQMGQKLPKFPRSPVTDFLESIYRMTDKGYGFDCSHAGDLSPRTQLLRGARPFDDEIYRNLAYVHAECESLALQLSRLQALVS